MAYKVQKPCKVCGKMYTPCSDCENDKSVFRWRKVACSMECGKKYFDKVMEARNLKEDVVEEPVVKNTEDKPVIIKKNRNKRESEQIDLEDRVY